MKLIFMFDSLAPNAMREYLVNEILFLREQGIDALVITLDKEDPKNTLYSDALFVRENFTLIPVPSLWSIPDCKKLKQHLEKEIPDVLITCGTKADFIGRIIAKLSGVPMKLFVFAHDLSEIRYRTKFYDDLLSHVTDYYIVTSEEAKFALSRLEVAPDKIVVMRDGILFEKYGQPSDGSIRRELGIRPDEFVFIFLGELIPEKNVEALLRALTKTTSGRLVIVGNGPDKKEILSLCNDFGLAERIIFLDSYSNIPGLLSESNAMVVSSKEEELFPTTILLGLLSGLPIITTDFRGVEELVKDHENGIVVRQQNSIEMSHAMEEIMGNGALYESLQKNTKKDLAKYSLSAHAAKLLSLAQEMRVK